MSASCFLFNVSSVSVSMCGNLSLAGAAIVLFLSRQNATKVLSRQTRVCSDKTRLLSRQRYACRDKRFIIYANCHKHHFCHDKGFVGTQDVFCCDMSRQNYVCRDKHVFVATKTFVTTKMMLVAVRVNNRNLVNFQLLRVPADSRAWKSKALSSSLKNSRESEVLVIPL